jgi:hypothetical protein
MKDSEVKWTVANISHILFSLSCVSLLTLLKEIIVV